MPDQTAQLQKAADALQRGNLALAEILCQNILDSGERHPAAVNILTNIAAAFGVAWRAQELLKLEIALRPHDPHVKANYDEARRRARDELLRRHDSRRRFLLIKAWGCGFCSDLDSVLGCLLLAEITGRTPVIHWGANSLYRSETERNAWLSFFEPVSRYSIDDLLGKSYSYFPPKWSDSNLHQEDINKVMGDASRMAGFYYLNQPEDVAVADFFTSVIGLVPWIRPNHPMAGKDLARIYRELARKYLKPRPEITAEVDAFAARHFAGRHIIAAHIRGGDKPNEDSGIVDRNRKCREALDERAARRPESPIFLLTDDARIVADIRARHGDRVITSDSLRVSADVGLHLEQQPDRRRLGLDIMRDIYLAARCDEFVGVGTTNVAAMILHLKDWQQGSTTLIPPNMHEIRNPFLHDC